MFKLVVLSALVAVAVARPGGLYQELVASPLLSTLVSEKTIESHGNTVVHGTAPVVHTAPIAYASPIAYTAPIVQKVHAIPHAAHLVAEKTIESHGNTVVHGTAPVISYAAHVPASISYAAVAGPALAYTAYGHPGAVSVW